MQSASGQSGKKCFAEAVRFTIHNRSRPVHHGHIRSAKRTCFLT